MDWANMPPNFDPKKLLTVQLFLVVVILSNVATAQFHENFESSSKSWRLAEADTGVTVLEHSRVFNEAKEGSGSEHIRFAAGIGTYVHLTHAMSNKAPLLYEPTPSVWVKANKPGMQLMLRVVLPNTKEPGTDKPIRTLIRGDRYAEIGKWERLSLSNLSREFQRMLVILRSRFGTRVNVDPTDAYCDLVVLNAYGSAGETKLWIDELEIEGMPPPDRAEDSNRDESANRTGYRWGDRQKIAEIDNGKLLALDRPLFLKGLEYSGESLEYVRGLGFNAIVLKSPATTELLELAKSQALWVVTPSSDSESEESERPIEEPILAWFLGSDLSDASLEATRSEARYLRSKDAKLARPVVGAMLTHSELVERELDIAIIEEPALGVTQELSDLALRLRRRVERLRRSAVAWSLLDLSPGKNLARQWRLTSPSMIATTDDAQARLVLRHSLASGVRGIVVRAGEKLDESTEHAVQLSEIARGINLEIDAFEPWLSGGEMEEPPTNRGSFILTTWRTERSKLAFLTHVAPFQQYCVSAPAKSSKWTFVWPGANRTDRVYRVTPTGPSPIPSRSTAPGLEVSVSEPELLESLILTEDSLALGRTTRELAANMPLRVETSRRLAQDKVQKTLEVIESLKPLFPADRLRARQVRDAQALIVQAQRRLAVNDLTAADLSVRQAERLLLDVRMDTWRRSVQLFPNSATSTTTMGFESLSAVPWFQWRMQNSAFRANLLPSGDFESLDALLAGQWRQERRSASGYESLVEIASERSRGGARSLRLVSRAASEGTRNELLPRIRVVSPELRIPQGQWYRVRGHYLIPKASPGILRIFDTRTGRDLALVLGETASNDWTEFLLYRVSPAEEPMRLVIEWEGEGETYVDDVSLDIAELTTNENERLRLGRGR